VAEQDHQTLFLGSTTNDHAEGDEMSLSKTIEEFVRSSIGHGSASDIERDLIEEIDQLRARIEELETALIRIATASPYLNESTYWNSREMQKHAEEALRDSLSSDKGE
jgi:hypothetical protein